MKRYAKVLIILLFFLICISSLLITYKLLLTEFIPTAVCAGEENFAVAERLKNNWCISVFKPNKERVYDVSFEADKSDRESMLCYSENEYYFGTIRFTDRNRMTVHKISLENEKHSQTELAAEEGEHLYDMHIAGNTMYVVGRKNDKDHTVLSVYTAGKESSEFTKKQVYTLPQTYFIRSAFYRSDGSLVFLTASGRVYSLSENNNEPTLIYDGSEYPAAGFCFDADEKICLLNYDGEVFRLTENNIAEPILKQMFAKLPQSVLEKNSSNFTGLSLRNDNFSAIMFLDEDDEWNVGFYKNGIFNIIDKAFGYSWWIFSLTFVGIIILFGITAYLLAFCIWRFFKDTVTMQYRISVIGITAAAVVLSVISVHIYQVYMEQKEEQNWERLTIMLNNARIYLQPEEQSDLERLTELDWDYDMQTAVNDEYIQKLWSFSNADISEDISCLLFIKGYDENLTAVSGSSGQIGKSAEQIYDIKTASRILNILEKSEGMLSGNYSKYGISYMYLAEPIMTDSSENPGVILMQMPLENEKELWIFITDLLLFIAVVGFLLILLMRIRSILKPLSQMEIQAQEFMITGNCGTIPIKGHNEITVLTSRFQQAVAEMKKSMEKSRLSAESYGRFVDRDWLALMGKENLSVFSPGMYKETSLAVLEMTLIPYKISEYEDERIKQYQELYEEILPIIKKNNGISENISYDHMRFLFPKSCFDAICTASVIGEIVYGRFDLKSAVDYGRAVIRICGSNTNLRVFSELQNEPSRMPLLYRKCSEFGCRILVTGNVVQEISDFKTIFNSRIIGFFSSGKNSTDVMQLIEILPQRCSDTFEQAVFLYQSGSYAKAFSMFSNVLEKSPKDKAAIRYLNLCNNKLKNLKGGEIQ